MTVLVTGGAGYIGSHMVWELLDHGESVVVIDNLSTGFDWAVPDRATFINGNVGDRKLVEKIIRDHDVDAVIHFAGSVVVPESIDDPLKYYHNNTSNSRNLLEAVVHCGVDKFIFSSTAAVYGEPLTRGPIREDAVLNPMSPYGSSKLMTEIMVRDTALASDLRYVMLRYFNVAGCDPMQRTGQSTQGATHLIKLACETALGRRPAMAIFGDDYDTPDGTCVRDFIHVSDLVGAHYAALEFLRQGGLKFTANCGYSRGYSVREVIQAVKRISGNDFPVVIEPRRPGDIAALTANSHRLTSRLSWQPRHDSLDKIITDALAWEEVLQNRRKSA
ncbi:MAG: UDP-glucose 4-epimerase GalE [Nitratireductor sp.]|nr:UDP-glucose 4-epimerase GalE [Nitratireductor sp.]